MLSFFPAEGEQKIIESLDEKCIQVIKETAKNFKNFFLAHILFHKQKSSKQICTFDKKNQ